jgi:hypothetical protein
LRPLCSAIIQSECIVTNDEEFEIFEVGGERERKFFVPGVTFGLEGMFGVEFFGGFFGFANEAVAAGNAEEVVGAFLAAGDLGAGFDFDFAMFLDEAGGIGDVPAEGSEEGVEEIVAELGFDVAGFFVFGKVVGEGIDQAGEFGLEGVEGGGWHVGVRIGKDLTEANEGNEGRRGKRKEEFQIADFGFWGVRMDGMDGAGFDRSGGGRSGLKPELRTFTYCYW